MFISVPINIGLLDLTLDQKLLPSCYVLCKGKESKIFTNEAMDFGLIITFSIKSRASLVQSSDTKCKGMDYQPILMRQLT